MYHSILKFYSTLDTDLTLISVYVSPYNRNVMHTYVKIWRRAHLSHWLMRNCLSGCIWLHIVTLVSLRIFCCQLFITLYHCWYIFKTVWSINKASSFIFCDAGDFMENQIIKNAYFPLQLAVLMEYSYIENI